MKPIFRTIAAASLIGVATLSSAQRVSRVIFSANPVQGGIGVTGTVELSAKVAKTAVVVTLTSSNPAAVAPASVTVPVGQANATFPITTTAVAADISAGIKAVIPGNSATSNLNVLAPRVTEFTFSPTSVQGGSVATGIVKLNSAAPVGGIKVALAANTPFWGGPPSFIVPPGATTGSFPVTTIPVVGVTDANVAASLNGSRIVANLNLTPAQFTTFRLTDPTLVGGVPTSGLLLLNGPAPKEGFRIKISCDSLFVKAPTTITIPSGQTSITFQIVTKAVTKPTVTRLSASGSGAWVELSLSIIPPPATAGHGR